MFSTKLRFLTRSFLLACCVLSAVVSVAYSQPQASPKYQSQEVSESDGIPVLIKHLPDWEIVRGSTTFAHSVAELKSVLGERPVLDLIDFVAGTEAVAAPYDAGKLLIIEFSTPQGSVDADAKFTANLYEFGDDTTVYRRIGNYNAFVFDAADKAAADALLDQVKYEKQVQWLGDNPFRISAERAFVLTTSDIFLSTVLIIMIGMGVAVFGGTIAGFIYFQLRERRRAAMGIYTDAGGMTRLNLDGFTPENLLNE